MKEVSAKLTVLGRSIDFTWLAEVSLKSDSNGWLGLVESLTEIDIKAGETRHIPVMFRQVGKSRVSWAEFIHMVENSNENQFSVEISLRFSQFTKTLNIRVSIELLKILFERGREKYRSDWPHRAQLRTIL